MGLIRIFLLWVFLIFVVGVQTVSAANNIVGTVIEQHHTYRASTYPLFANKTIHFTNPSVIKFPGGTLIVEPGSVLTATEHETGQAFELDKGKVRFRLLPEKSQIGIKTPHAIVFTPKILPVQNEVVSGSIEVTQQDTTIVAVDEGNIKTVTRNGITTITAGQVVILAQSVAQSDISADDDKDAQSVPDPKDSDNTIFPEADEEQFFRYLGLIGSLADTKTNLDPTGELEIRNVYEWEGEGQIVDYSLKSLLDSSVPKNTTVKVVCMRTDREEALVRSVDKLYPQHSNELDLIGKLVISQSSLNPEGRLKLDKESKESWRKGEEFRSWELWDGAIVDHDLQPYVIEGESKTKFIDEYDEKGARYIVACIRTTLLLQPMTEIPDETFDLHGKQALNVTALAPSGEVTIEGTKWNAVLVDYNLRPIEGLTVPKGSKLSVVGYKSSQNTVLVQAPKIMLGENKYVGDTVVVADEIDPYGIVTLNGNEWWGLLVDKDLELVVGTKYKKGKKLRVVAVMTSLLVQPDPVLLALFPVSHFPIFSSFIAGGLVTGVIVGGVVAIITADDNPQEPEDPPASSLIP